MDKAAAGTASRKAAEKTPTDVEMSDADKKEGRHLTAGGVPAPVGGEPGKGAKAPIVQPDIMHRQPTSRSTNPVVRLTVKLLDTYQNINEKYYAKHNKRSQDQWDDEHGDYIIRAGDMINNRYVDNRIILSSSFSSSQTAQVH